jgi:putative sigma-54 modulation protein
MKITYTGKQSVLPATLQKKLDARFAKLGKLLDRRKGENEAHVILTNERHLQRAEITVQFFDHPLVGIGANSDQFQSMMEAVEKLEKQILKLREKWRDTKRGSVTTESKWAPPAPPAAKKAEKPAKAAVKKARRPAEAAPGDEEAKRIYRVNRRSNGKPMTLDEAMLELESEGNYVVYRDSETDRVQVLVKRDDGHFDLIES